MTNWFKALQLGLMILAKLQLLLITGSTNFSFDLSINNRVYLITVNILPKSLQGSNPVMNVALKQ